MFFKNRKSLKVVGIIIASLIVLSLVLGMVAPYIF